MYKTDAIVSFMQDHYTDEKLAALLAHAEDGKLGYLSCCCFVGVPTANHALRPACEEFDDYIARDGHSNNNHSSIGRLLANGVDAEQEFCGLGTTDEQRRANLIPLIRAEMERREALSASVNERDTEGVGNANNSYTRESPAQSETSHCPTPTLSSVR